jgi:hypothetical protein
MFIARRGSAIWYGQCCVCEIAALTFRLDTGQESLAVAFHRWCHRGSAPVDQSDRDNNPGDIERKRLLWRSVLRLRLQSKQTVA